MSVVLGPATCPSCGTVDSIFIRSDDGTGLVCRGDSPASTSANPLPDVTPRSSRQSVARALSGPAPVGARTATRRIE